MSNESLRRQRGYAWAQYYREVERSHSADHDLYNKMRTATAWQSEIPPHILTEYKEMLATLRKTIDCPICLEVIPPAGIAFTPCGHKYCEACLATLKRQTAPKCALCRRRLKRAREPEPEPVGAREPEPED